MYLLAVDPGLSGAVAVFHDLNGLLIDVIDIPSVDSGKGFVSRTVDATGLHFAIEQYVPRIERAGDRVYGVQAVMEHVGAMPKQGASSVFSLGDSRGCIRGVLKTLGVPVEEVTPQKWKKHFNLVRVKGEDKNVVKEQARALALHLFPAFHSKLKNKKDHNRAEAMLLGRYFFERKPK